MRIGDADDGDVHHAIAESSRFIEVGVVQIKRRKAAAEFGGIEGSYEIEVPGTAAALGSPDRRAEWNPIANLPVVLLRELLADQRTGARTLHGFEILRLHFHLVIDLE